MLATIVLAGAAEEAAMFELVDSSRTPRVAAHDAPRGDDRPAGDPELANRLDRIARTTRVIATAGLQVGRDQPPVEVNRREKSLAKGSAKPLRDRFTCYGAVAFHVLRPCPSLSDQLAQSCVDATRALTLNQTCRVRPGN